MQDIQGTFGEDQHHAILAEKGRFRDGFAGLASRPKGTDGKERNKAGRPGRGRYNSKTRVAGVLKPAGSRKGRALAGIEGRGGGFGAAAYALVIAFFVVTLLAILNGLGDTIGRALQDFVDSLPLPT